MKVNKVVRIALAGGIIGLLATNPPPGAQPTDRQGEPGRGWNAIHFMPHVETNLLVAVLRLVVLVLTLFLWTLGGPATSSCSSARSPNRQGGEDTRRSVGVADAALDPCMASSTISDESCAGPGGIERCELTAGFFESVVAAAVNGTDVAEADAWRIHSCDLAVGLTCRTRTPQQHRDGRIRPSFR